MLGAAVRVCTMKGFRFAFGTDPDLCSGAADGTAFRDRKHPVRLRNTDTFWYDLISLDNFQHAVFPDPKTLHFTDIA